MLAHDSVENKTTAASDDTTNLDDAPIALKTVGGVRGDVGVDVDVVVAIVMALGTTCRAAVVASWERGMLNASAVLPSNSSKAMIMTARSRSRTQSHRGIAQLAAICIIVNGYIFE